jgi:hypothetical protein
MEEVSAGRRWARRLFPVVAVLFPLLLIWLVASFVPQGQLALQQLGSGFIGVANFIGGILWGCLVIALFIMVIGVPVILGFIARVILEYVDLGLYPEDNERYVDGAFSMSFIWVWIAAITWGVAISVAQYLYLLVADQNASFHHIASYFGMPSPLVEVIPVGLMIFAGVIGFLCFQPWRRRYIS